MTGEMIMEKANCNIAVKDCMSALRKIKDASFATVDADGRPQVRIIDIMLADDEAVYFCTARGKDFYKELMATGMVSVVGLTDDWKMIRINGTARKLENQKEWIDKIFVENPSMNSVYPGDARYVLEPFTIDRGSAEYFDLAEEPIYRRSLGFGGEKAVAKGFVVEKEECIGCGICAEACPQKSIDISEEKAEIRQENCLHCGLCCEKCPVEAIKRRN